MGEEEYGKERLMQGQSLIYDRIVWYNMKYYETKGECSCAVYVYAKSYSIG